MPDLQPQSYDLRPAADVTARAHRAHPPTRRYRVTENGARTALCYHRTHARVMKPAIAVSFDPATRSTSRLRRVIDAFDHEIKRLREGRQLAA